MILIMEKLIDLEAELRNLVLWEHEPPSVAALASTEPFSIDTLTFPQWLQFVFIPKMRWMIEQDISLPPKCGIAPMAEECFPALRLNGQRLVELLDEIDILLGNVAL